MQVNQQGHLVVEEYVDFSDLSLEDRKEAVDLLFKELGIDIYRTNATKHGYFMLELRKANT